MSDYFVASVLIKKNCRPKRAAINKNTSLSQIFRRPDQQFGKILHQTFITQHKTAEVYF